MIKKIVIVLVMVFASSANALEVSGECANQAIKASYEVMIEDMFEATSKNLPIETLLLDMKTVSSKLTRLADIESGHIYSVVIHDNTNSKDLEFSVEVTVDGCYLKRAEQLLSGEE